MLVRVEMSINDVLMLQARKTLVLRPRRKSAWPARPGKLTAL